MKNIYRLACGLVLTGILLLSGCVVVEKEKLTSEDQVKIQEQKKAQVEQILNFSKEMLKILIMLVTANIIMVWILPAIIKRNKRLRNWLGWNNVKVKKE